MKIRISIAVAAALIASPGLATGKKEKAAENPGEKKVCRMETGTGTILRKRVCRTQAEIDAAAARGEDGLRRTREGSITNRASF